MNVWMKLPLQLECVDLTVLSAVSFPPGEEESTGDRSSGGVRWDLLATGICGTALLLGAVVVIGIVSYVYKQKTRQRHRRRYAVIATCSEGACHVMLQAKALALTLSVSQVGVWCECVVHCWLLFLCRYIQEVLSMYDSTDSTDSSECSYIDDNPENNNLFDKL